MDELSEWYEDRLTILAVDVEQSPELAAHYEIETVPMVLFFKNGEMAEAVESANLSEVYREIIDELL